MQSLTLENLEFPREAKMFAPKRICKITVKPQVITLPHTPNPTTQTGYNPFPLFSLSVSNPQANSVKGRGGKNRPFFLSLLTFLPPLDRLFQQKK